MRDTPDPASTLSEIRKKTDLALRLRSKRDAGKFQSVGAALGLQQVEKELALLRRELPPLTLVVDNTLPPTE